jgi:hypothetical protein
MLDWMSLAVLLGRSTVNVDAVVTGNQRHFTVRCTVFFLFLSVVDANLDAMRPMFSGSTGITAGFVSALYDRPNFLRHISHSASIASTIPQNRTQIAVQ